MILAIDPGNIQSGYVSLNNDLTIREFGKVDNYDLLDNLHMDRFFREGDDEDEEDYFAIEMIASYGMAVGATVFDTCVWIGRFIEACSINHKYIYRKDEKMNLCGTMRAKDTNIRQALIDRFGIVGKKKTPGFFYGFKADIWAAMAVGVTYYDMYLKDK